MATRGFSKWQGTGNDFILFDDRDGRFPADDLDLVRRLCDRHFGIGSDGLILVQAPREAGTAYHMEFFNPDGSKSFCGNGSRCAYACWSALSGEREPARFTAIDGVHEAEWLGGEVAITLSAVERVQRDPKEPRVDFIHNGSPHELVHVEDPAQVAIMVAGPERRYAAKHAPGGTNVNFMRVIDGVVHMRTYERGVEAETLSCGTGVVAAALSALARGEARAPVTVIAPGGTLRVEARAQHEGFTDIRLIGPVGEVFRGEVDV
ncbi:MAG TPA: diaminopimelate epimerase [Flavobacteriales bacterium]|nr:diaminopimelate epimerase [Flavobacteriales bacterium]